jgi:hypothetical protein
LEQIHGGAAGAGCVWLTSFEAELVFWIWSFVELSQTQFRTRLEFEALESPYTTPATITRKSLFDFHSSLYLLKENGVI